MAGGHALEDALPPQVTDPLVWQLEGAESGGLEHGWAGEGLLTDVMPSLNQAGVLSPFGDHVLKGEDACVDGLYGEPGLLGAGLLGLGVDGMSGVGSGVDDLAGSSGADMDHWLGTSLPSVSDPASLENPLDAGDAELSSLWDTGALPFPRDVKPEGAARVGESGPTRAEGDEPAGPVPAAAASGLTSRGNGRAPVSKRPERDAAPPAALRRGAPRRPPAQVVAGRGTKVGEPERSGGRRAGRQPQPRPQSEGAMEDSTSPPDVSADPPAAAGSAEEAAGGGDARSHRGRAAYKGARAPRRPSRGGSSRLTRAEGTAAGTPPPVASATSLDAVDGAPAPEASANGTALPARAARGRRRARAPTAARTAASSTPTRPPSASRTGDARAADNARSEGARPAGGAERSRKRAAQGTRQPLRAASPIQPPSEAGDDQLSLDGGEYGEGGGQSSSDPAGASSNVVAGETALRAGARQGPNGRPLTAAEAAVRKAQYQARYRVRLKARQEEASETRARLTAEIEALRRERVKLLGEREAIQAREAVRLRALAILTAARGTPLDATPRSSESAALAAGDSTGADAPPPPVASGGPSSGPAPPGSRRGLDRLRSEDLRALLSSDDAGALERGLLFPEGSASAGDPSASPDSSASGPAPVGGPSGGSAAADAAAAPGASAAWPDLGGGDSMTLTLHASSHLSGESSATCSPGAVAAAAALPARVPDRGAAAPPPLTPPMPHALPHILIDGKLMVPIGGARGGAPAPPATGAPRPAPAPAAAAAAPRFAPFAPAARAGPGSSASSDRTAASLSGPKLGGRSASSTPSAVDEVEEARRATTTGERPGQAAPGEPQAAERLSAPPEAEGGAERPRSAGGGGTAPPLARAAGTAGAIAAGVRGGLELALTSGRAGAGQRSHALPGPRALAFGAAPLFRHLHRPREGRPASSTLLSFPVVDSTTLDLPVIPGPAGEYLATCYSVLTVEAAFWSPRTAMWKLGTPRAGLDHTVAAFAAGNSHASAGGDGDAPLTYESYRELTAQVDALGPQGLSAIYSDHTRLAARVLHFLEDSLRAEGARDPVTATGARGQGAEAAAAAGEAGAAPPPPARGGSHGRPRGLSKLSADLQAIKPHWQRLLALLTLSPLRIAHVIPETQMLLGNPRWAWSDAAMDRMLARMDLSRPQIEALWTIRGRFHHRTKSVFRDVSEAAAAVAERDAATGERPAYKLSERAAEGVAVADTIRRTRALAAEHQRAALEFQLSSASVLSLEQFLILTIESFPNLADTILFVERALERTLGAGSLEPWIA